MRFRKLQISVFMLLLIVSFQNCEGPKESSETTTSSKKKSGSSTSASTADGSGLSVGSARNATVASPTSSGSISSGGASGSSTSGGTSGSTSGGTCLGCTGGSSGSTGGGTGGMIGGSGSYALEISQQPKSATIPEGAEFTVGVSVKGGKPPYSFKWYRDNSLLPPIYGDTHYESYTSTLDRIYKEGDYHVVVTDADGTSKTSYKASIRMVAKTCNAGAYWFPVTTQSQYPDVYNWIGDLFIYGSTKYFASQYSPIVAQLQGRYSRTMEYLGFRYFNLGATVSNNQNFTISCGTDVPTVHSSVCSKDAPSKCNYWDVYQNAEITKRYYEGSISFTCRNGYLQFTGNTCKLITPPPPPPDTSGGG